MKRLTADLILADAPDPLWLAMDLKTLRGIRQPALSLTTIASKLAPTGFQVDHNTCDHTKPCGNGLAREGGLTADLTFADAPDPLWERACSRWT